MRSLIDSAIPREGCATRLRSRVVLVASVLVPALLSALLACSGSSPPSAEVKPGDRDYPTPNPHPGDIVQVRVLIPPTLKIALSVWLLRLAEGRWSDG